MQYRRFGKTELQMPVFSCGGMRYQQSWQDVPPGEIDAANQANLEATIHAAVDQGMTHIETARGYGSSEYQLGKILPSLPREDIIVQTKIGPKESEKDFLDTFNHCMSLLQLDYIDLLGVHGINTHGLLDLTLTQGTMAACRKLQAQGRVRHVGFSTHGPTDAIVATVESGEFDYMNLHWYYFDQRNWPAIEAATARDMGVFIISPSDKGGKLYAPPPKLVDLCAPLTPMGFNNLFCLSHPQVHTLSVGAERPTDFDAHLDVLDKIDAPGTHMAPVQSTLYAELENTFDADWAAHWHENLPWLVDAPGPVPAYHIVRLHNLVKAYDMLEFGKMRYNLLGNADHWFPGLKPDTFDDAQLLDGLRNYRFADRVPDILRETHALLNEGELKRQSES